MLAAFFCFGRGRVGEIQRWFGRGGIVGVCAEKAEAGRILRGDRLGLRRSEFLFRRRSFGRFDRRAVQKTEGRRVRRGGGLDLFGQKIETASIRRFGIRFGVFRGRSRDIQAGELFVVLPHVVALL